MGTQIAHVLDTHVTLKPEWWFGPRPVSLRMAALSLVMTAGIALGMGLGLGMAWCITLAVIAALGL